jgi:hypothetical protein
MRSRKIVTPVVLLLAAVVGTGLYGAIVSGSAASPDASGLPPDKARALAVEQQWQQQLQADAADPAKSAAIIAAKKAEAARVAAASAAPVPQKWPEGIFADREAPAPGSVFLCTNRWVGTVAGRSVAVYAGRAGDDPATGRLMVVNAAADMSIDSSRFVDLPGSGELRITSANGTTLTIVDAQGGEYTFAESAYAP